MTFLVEALIDSSQSRKLPKDANQRAAEIVRLATEEPQQESSPDPNPITVYLASIGRKGGLKVGKGRAAKSSKKKRSEIARKAAKTRWSSVNN
jgi:hypothetical protein